MSVVRRSLRLFLGIFGFIRDLDVDIRSFIILLMRFRKIFDRILFVMRIEGLRKIIDPFFTNFLLIKDLENFFLMSLQAARLIA